MRARGVCIVDVPDATNANNRRLQQVTDGNLDRLIRIVG